jgi:hypothetical protein
VKIGGADLRELVKRDDFDPAGFLLSGLKSEVKRRYRVSIG